MSVETTITKDDGVGSEIEAVCAKCGEGVAHVIRASIKEHNADEPHSGYSFEWINQYEIIQCGGCKMFSFRRAQSNSEDFDPVTGYHPELIELFPRRVKDRGPLNDYELLPGPLQRIYLETLKAINSEQPILAGMGIRAIVETVCKHQAATHGSLEQKIDELVSKHVLTKAGAEILHKLRVIGNKATHEAEPHDLLQLGFAMDVIDNLISSVYILPHHSNARFR